MRAVRARGSHGKTNAASAALLPSRSHAPPSETRGSFSSKAPLGLLQEQFCWKRSAPFGYADVCPSFGFCFPSIKTSRFERLQAPRSFLVLPVLLLRTRMPSARGKCFGAPQHPQQDNLKAPRALLKRSSLILKCRDRCFQPSNRLPCPEFPWLDGACV